MTDKMQQKTLELEIQKLQLETEKCSCWGKNFKEFISVRVSKVQEI